MAQRNKKKQGYQSWNSPPEVLDPLRAFMPISFDPCSNPHSMVGADVALAAPDCDGLAVAWHLYAHTYVNPPYDDQPEWMRKAAIARHFYEAQHITMLIPASTETQGFQEIVFGTADAVCFWHRALEVLARGRRGRRGQHAAERACILGRRARAVRRTLRALRRGYDRLGREARQMTTKTGSMADFLQDRERVMGELIESAGGLYSEGGTVAGVARRERSLGVPGSKEIDNWPVDIHDRALGCMREVLTQEKLELQIVVYDAPRAQYQDVGEPMAHALGYNQLH